jgi:hypothetical protein
MHLPTKLRLRTHRVFLFSHSLISTLYYGLVAAEAHGIHVGADLHGALAGGIAGCALAGLIAFHTEEGV